MVEKEGRFRILTNESFDLFIEEVLGVDVTICPFFDPFAILRSFFYVSRSTVDIGVARDIDFFSIFKKEGRVT